MLDFMQKQYTVATSVHINLPKTPFFCPQISVNFSLNIVIMVAQDVFFSEIATVLILSGQNCENTTAKKSETRTKVDFLFERANIFCPKSQLVKLAQKVRKNQLFETNSLSQISKKGGTVNFHITLISTLVF